MREAEELIPHDADVPEVLRRLKPATPAVSVARSIWYQSGYQAGRHRLNLWRGATVSLAIGMATLLGWQSVARRAGDQFQTVIVKMPAAPNLQPPTDGSSSSYGSYARLLNALTQDGPRNWSEDDLPIGNPHTPPTRHSYDVPELNAYPINERG